MVYNPSLYLTLNNYGYNNESIAQVKECLSLDTNGKIKRFLEKWETNFKIENDELVHSPLNVMVILDDKRSDVLKKTYEDITQGPAQGIDMLYARVRDKYLNIRRSDVSTFLRSQKLYQINKSQNHTINKPIMSTSPNGRWRIDCILTVVDHFSRKCFLRALKSQTAINVRNALINIVAETESYPRLIMADNGSEFQGETVDWFKQHNITYIKNFIIFTRIEWSCGKSEQKSKKGTAGDNDKNK
jgi:hypothetical protein